MSLKKFNFKLYFGDNLSLVFHKYAVYVEFIINSAS